MATKNITSVVWESSNLPNGVLLDKDTGVLSGTPSVDAGEYSSLIKVTTNYGSDEKEVLLNIEGTKPSGKDILIDLGYLGYSKTVSGDKIYIPLSLFGWRNVTPSEEITIKTVKWTYSANLALDRTAIPNGTIYYDSYTIGGVNSTFSIDKTTGNFFIDRTANNARGNQYIRTFCSIETNMGIDPLWRAVYIGFSNDASAGDLRTGDFTVTLNADNSIKNFDPSSGTRVGTLTTTNYRENKIYV